MQADRPLDPCPLPGRPDRRVQLRAVEGPPVAVANTSASSSAVASRVQSLRASSGDNGTCRTPCATSARPARRRQTRETRSRRLPKSMSAFVSANASRDPEARLSEQLDEQPMPLRHLASTRTTSSSVRARVSFTGAAATVRPSRRPAAGFARISPSSCAVASSAFTGAIRRRTVFRARPAFAHSAAYCLDVLRRDRRERHPAEVRDGAACRSGCRPSSSPRSRR